MSRVTELELELRDAKEAVVRVRAAIRYAKIQQDNDDVTGEYVDPR